MENQAIAKTGNRASGLVGPALSGMLKVEKKAKKGRKKTNRRSSRRGNVCVALLGFRFRMDFTGLHGEPSQKQIILQENAH